MPVYRKISLIIVGLFHCVYGYSQEIFPKDSINNKLFQLSVEVGAGASYYSTKPNVPEHLETSVSKMHEAFSFRVNWKTDHRLTISLESGLLEFYRFKLNSNSAEGDLKITAIPLLLEFAMPLTKKFQIRAGAGSYFQTTELNYLGKVRSKSVSLGWIAGGSYLFFSNERNALGCELKWMDAAESEQAAFVMQMSYRYTLVKW
jgi:hypothetical protein